MLKLDALIDKLILMICCLLIYLFQFDYAVSVVMVLIALIFSGFLSYFDDERLIFALTLGFIVLSYFSPEFVTFLPVIIYDSIFCRYRYVNLLAIIPLVHYLSLASDYIVVVSLVVLILGILLRYRAEILYHLQGKQIQLNDEAREMSLQLQKQNRDLVEKQDNELHVATLNERNRIAREIHDNVGHLLSSAILQAGALQKTNRDQIVSRQLEELHTTLAQAMDSTRSSVHALYEESLDLNHQISKLVNDFTFCELTYEYAFSSNAPKKLKYAFVAIVREALSNLMKHSNATHTSIILREHPALYQLIIRDNGKVKAYDPDEGLGLKNMTNRIHALNGVINIITEDGFEIFVSIPKEGPGLEGTDY